AMRFIKGDNLKEAIERFHGTSRPPGGTGPTGAEGATSPDRRSGPTYDSMEFRQLLRRFVDVCNAVAYAHSRSVLHRDLKPGNVMLGQYGETLLVDWGLAKTLGRAGSTADTAEPPLVPRSSQGSSATVHGHALGTPAYMSPE